MSYNSNLVSMAQSRARSNVLHTAKLNGVFPTVRIPGTDIALASNNAVNVAAHKINTEMLPDSGSLANALSSGDQIYFKIPRGTVFSANGVTLELDIVNNTGAATTLCDAYHLIDRITFYGPNGSKELQYIEGDALYISTILVDQTKWASVALLANTTNAWGNGSAIGNGASVKYYIKVLANIWSTSKQILSRVNGDLRIEVRFKPFSVTNAAAGAAPTLRNATLILDDYRVDSNERMSIEQIPVRDGRFYDIVPQKFTQTLAASTEYTFRLTGLKGLASMLLFFIRASGATGNALKTFQAVDSFEFEDATGKNLIGGNQQDSDFNRYHETPELFDSEFARVHPLYLISASTDPVSDLLMGQLNGYMVLSGDEMLRFTTPSTLVGGSFEITIYGYIASHVRVNQRGEVLVEHS